MKALDIVLTPKKQIAMIVEIVDNAATIAFLGKNTHHEHNAWYDESELQIIDSLPALLTRNLKHPFSEDDNDD